MCALSTAHVKKGKPKFVKMIFLGRTLQNNMYVCGTSLGIYLSSTIRRLPPTQQWAGDLLKSFSGKPWKYGLAVLGNRLVPGLPMRNPVPALDDVPATVVMPRLPQRADPGPDEAGSDPPSTPTTPKEDKDPIEALLADYAVDGPQDGDVDVQTQGSEPRPGSAAGQGGRSSTEDVSTAGPLPVESAPMLNVMEGATKRPAGELQPAPPFAADEPPRSSKARIQHVVVDGEELFDYDEGPISFEFDVGDDDLADYCGSVGGETYQDLWSGRTEDEGPPECTEEQLYAIDRESESVEANRLVQMHVLEPVAQQPSADLLLQTRYVLDWRYRDGWKRRARLVSKELKVWDPHRLDVYAPSTSPAMIKVVPAMFASMQNEDWYLWGIDIKDAFLTVPQKSLLYVKLDGVYYKVLKCLPGQRQAGAWWCDQITQDLIDANLVQNPSCPVAFGNGHAACAIHVDDGVLGGKLEEGIRIISKLQEKYTLSVTGPIRELGEQMRFLKRIFVVESEGLAMYSDPKYINKILNVLEIKNPRKRKVPTNPEWCTEDQSTALDERQHGLYRMAVGCLLYIAPDRCDIQFGVSMLARKVQSPTTRDMKFLKHLVEYVATTIDYHLVMKWGCPGKSVRDRRDSAEAHPSLDGTTHLIEVLTDSDWAGSPDRKSISSVHVYLNSILIHSFVRKQDTISLSSCESELISAVSGAADGMFIRSIVETMSCETCALNLLLDNSSARLLIYKTGSSKIRHLDARLLWVQEKCRSGKFKVMAIPTRINMSDLGTKPLGAERVRMLLGLAGFHDHDGPIGQLEYQKNEQGHHVCVLSKSQKRAMIALLMLTASEAVNPETNTSNVIHISWSSQLQEFLQSAQMLVEMLEREREVQQWSWAVFAVLIFTGVFWFLIGIVIGKTCCSKYVYVTKVATRSSHTRSSASTHEERLEPLPLKLAVSKYGRAYHVPGCVKLKNCDGVRELQPCGVCKP